MDIYELFSAHTKLPVRIDHVRDFVLERGYVDEIKFYGVDINPQHMRGMCHVFHRSPGVYANSVVCAEIVYANELCEAERRIVLCKELLHLTENTNAAAQTRQQVDKLIEEIAVPLTFKASLPGISDHCGELNAIRILLPRDALEILKPLVDTGKLTVEEVSSIAKIPVMYCRMAFNPMWDQLTSVLSG